MYDHILWSYLNERKPRSTTEYGLILVVIFKIDKLQKTYVFIPTALVLYPSQKYTKVWMEEAHSWKSRSLSFDIPHLRHNIDKFYKEQTVRTYVSVELRKHPESFRIYNRSKERLTHMKRRMILEFVYNKNCCISERNGFLQTVEYRKCCWLILWTAWCFSACFQWPSSQRMKEAKQSCSDRNSSYIIKG